MVAPQWRRLHHVGVLILVVSVVTCARAHSQGHDLDSVNNTRDTNETACDSSADIVVSNISGNGSDSNSQTVRGINLSVNETFIPSLGSVLDKNLTKCLLSSKLVTCFKVSLLERLTQLLEVSERVQLNRTMDLMDGFVSLEPGGEREDDVNVELIERMKKERESVVDGDKDSDKELDLLLISGLARFFKGKTLKLHFIPGYTIELHPAKTYSDYVSLSLKLSGETPEQVAARTIKMGGPFMMLGPMITLGMLPFSLASLNYMVMNAYAMNNMALMNVLWTTIRDHVFEEQNEDVVYRNPGYANEYKKYRNRGYENEKKAPSGPPVFQHGKPIVHHGLKTSSFPHAHIPLHKHRGPPRPFVHFHQPPRDALGSLSHKHIKSVTIPAGDKLRLVNLPPPTVVKPNIIRPSRPSTVVTFPDGANFRIPAKQHIVRRPSIPLNNGPKFVKHHFVNNGGHNLNGGGLFPTQNGDHHSPESNYVNEVNRIKNIHASQSVPSGPNFGNLNQHNVVTEGHNVHNQFSQNTQNLNSNSFAISEAHNIPVFDHGFQHNGPNFNQREYETSGSHGNNIFTPGSQTNGPHLHENNIGAVSNSEESHRPIIVVNDHDGNVANHGFNSQNVNEQNAFSNPNLQQNHQIQIVGSHPEQNYEPISHNNQISNDVHLLTTGQQGGNQNFGGGDVFVGPVQFENHQSIPSYQNTHQHSPSEPTFEYKPADSFEQVQRASTGAAASTGGEGAEWVPQNHGQADNVQNWPIVYIDPTNGQHASADPNSNLEPARSNLNNQQVDSGVHHQEQFFTDKDSQSNPHGSQGDIVQINFGNNQRTSKVNNDERDPSDPAISLLDSVDLDDKPFSDVGTAQRLVQHRPQIIQPSIHIDSPYSPIFILESDAVGQKRNEQTIGFRPTSLPISQPGNNRRSDTPDEGGEDSEWKPPQSQNFENVKDVDKTSIIERSDVNRRSDVIQEDENEWKAANNPKFENQNRRSDVVPEEDTKTSKNIPFRNKGGFGFVVDDNESRWKSKHKAIDTSNGTTDIIYDDSHDGNWEIEPGLTEEVFVVENVHEEPILKPRDTNKSTGR